MLTLPRNNSNVGASAIQSEAGRAQELYVQLLFSASTRREWQVNPSSVLQHFGLSRSWMSKLPDVGSEQFLSECHGRRQLVARELHPKYGRSISLILGLQSLGDFATSKLLADFLESTHFLTPNHSLPHPYGIGRGYENASKFFLWIRDTRIAGSSSEVRKGLCIDFAIHLIGQSSHSQAEPLILARNGVIFRADPAHDDDWYMMDPTLQLVQFRVDDMPSLYAAPCFFVDMVDQAGNYVRPQGFRNQER